MVCKITHNFLECKHCHILLNLTCLYPGNSYFKKILRFGKSKCAPPFLILKFLMKYSNEQLVFSLFGWDCESQPNKDKTTCNLWVGYQARAFHLNARMSLNISFQIRQSISYGKWTFNMVIYTIVYITKSDIFDCIFLTLFMQMFACL